MSGRLDDRLRGWGLADVAPGVHTPRMAKPSVRQPIARRTFLLAAASLPLGVRALTAAVPTPSAPSGSRFVPAGADRSGHPRHVLGDLRIDAKLTPRESAGALYAIENVSRGPGGPPRHVHHEQDEWFFVLEGRYRIEVGEERFELGPGDSILGPRQIAHVWAHVGDGVGRLLISFQPAGTMEEFFVALAAAGDGPSREEMASLFDQHGMTLLGPPLSAG